MIDNKPKDYFKIFKVLTLRTIMPAALTTHGVIELYCTTLFVYIITG